MTEVVPRILGRYEIQEEIGRGMMGVVFKAHDPALGRTVALKTVRLAFSIPEAEREVFEKRFLAEARVSAGLNHPGIVVVHDVGRDAETGTLFIALEFLHGRPLSQVVADGEAMDWRDALRLAARIAEALHHAHAQGIVHRDVKPANIMVLPSGEPKIMDFGIAKIPTSHLTSAGEFFGTPLYMSPEQAKGEPLDGRSDLFSLGSVLYLLLTGQRAFDAANVPAILTKVATTDPPPPSAIAVDVSPDVDYIVARTLAKDPADRYPDGKTLAEDALDVLADRAPRHRATWRTPERTEGTWVSVTPLDDPELADLSPPAGSAPRGTASLARPGSPAPRREPDEAGLLIRLSDRIGRRGFFALGALVAAGLVAAMLLPRRPSPQPESGPPGTPGAAGGSGAQPAAEATATPKPSFLGGLFGKEPAHLEVVFEHSLRSGTLKVWVDDDLVLDEKLQSVITRKIGPLKMRRGLLKKVLDVPEGDHMVKIQVQGDDFFGASRIKGSFEKGVTRRLEVNKGGLPLLKKELLLEWS